MSAVLLSTFILLFLPSSSVSLTNFNLAVPMRECTGEHSCMSSPFSIAILNETCSLRSTITAKTFWTRSAIQLNSEKKKNIAHMDRKNANKQETEEGNLTLDNTERCKAGTK